MAEVRVVTFDLDSTLCDTEHRHWMIDRVNGTDWDAYSRACAGDGLVQATAALIHMLAAVGYQIHYVTGRTVASLKETRAWLDKHNLPCDGLWMDETDGADHIATYGGHAQYKVARVRDVAAAAGVPVSLHVDDWADVKAALEADGVPTICVRTPTEIRSFVSGLLA